MRHLNLLLMAFFFMFIAQAHAAKVTKKATSTIAKSSQKRPSVSGNSDGMTVTFKSAPSKANTGDSSCPFKNTAFSPFSREGKHTPANKMKQAAVATNKAKGIN